MFRDERDALQHQADALSQRVRESDAQLRTLQQEKQRSEQENQQLKKKLSALGHLPRTPLWRSPLLMAVLGACVLGAAAFGVLHFTKPRATLTWSASVSSASGVSVAPGAACEVSGTFSTNGKLDTNLEALRIECNGSLVKNTVYPFGGEGWSLLEEKRGEAFQYQLKQSSGDFRVDTTTEEAALYSKNNPSTPTITFRIEPWSAPRSGAPLFAN